MKMTFVIVLFRFSEAPWWILLDFYTHGEINIYGRISWELKIDKVNRDLNSQPEKFPHSHRTDFISFLGLNVFPGHKTIPFCVLPAQQKLLYHLPRLTNSFWLFFLWKKSFQDNHHRILWNFTPVVSVNYVFWLHQNVDNTSSACHAFP